MQHIGIQSENERGEEIQVSEINFANVLIYLFELDDYKVTYPWLATIYPYGNTVFNALQTAHLIRELEALSVHVNNNLKKDINSVITFMENLDQYHYVKFIGD